MSKAIDTWVKVPVQVRDGTPYCVMKWKKWKEEWNLGNRQPDLKQVEKADLKNCIALTSQAIHVQNNVMNQPFDLVSVVLCTLTCGTARHIFHLVTYLWVKPGILCTSFLSRKGLFNTCHRRYNPVRAHCTR